MFSDSPAFSGFSVNDQAAAKQFYGQVLGLDVEDTGMGLELRFKDGHSVFVYPKPDHQPAAYTMLNFPVDDIDAAVDKLAEQGVSTIKYDNMPGDGQDAKGIMRGRSANMGPDIAWFNDPAGNILAVLQN